MTVRCPLCGSITLHADSLIVWALAIGAMLALTLEALMIAALVHLAGA
jgi:hypothetical protein